MAVLKCKKCGADLPYTTGTTVAVCEYCNVKQTLPKNNDETIQNMFNRATHLRMKAEFDKAEQIYEKILQLDNQESEAHWGLVLCKYGIEYVEDSKTSQRVPTCHRASFESVTTDVEYLAAIANADADQKALYEADAKAIDKIQKDILKIVKNEKPFDVFICYKQSDENNKRTPDSVIANDIYHQLTQEGLKVFYAAITLEDKLGQEYEPYIFAALNSAKVMLVIGTKPEYFSAIWVKNEWSRFLKLMKTDRNKLLIPCYKDMDAYDLPEEFSHLQAQDMSKIGFINDVVRGIRKVLVKEEPKPTVVKETVITESNTNIAPLLKRAFMFLEDGDWTSANEYCEKVLDLDPECARAYLGKLMAQLKVHKQEALKDCAQPFDSNNNYQKVLRFGEAKLVEELKSYVNHIKNRIETAQKEAERKAETDKKNELYFSGRSAMTADTISGYETALNTFRSISGWRDTEQLISVCQNRIAELKKQKETAQKNAKYSDGKLSMARDTITGYEVAINTFRSIPGWRDADQLIDVCHDKIAALKEQEKAAKAAAERKAEEERKAAAIRAEEARKRAAKAAIRKGILATIGAAVVCGIIAFVIILTTSIIPGKKYDNAMLLMEKGDYTGALSQFLSIRKYKDSAAKIEECTAIINEGKYNDALTLLEAGNYSEAEAAFQAIANYKDSQNLILECRYRSAATLKENGDLYGAATAFVNLGEYRDAKAQSAALWSEITIRNTIYGGSHHTVVIKADETVAAVGKNDNGQCNVEKWTDIVAISAGNYHTVGLKSDGTVVAKGINDSNQCDVSEWTDIVAISASGWHTVGLKSDGTVVATGNNRNKQCNVSEWTDIVAISAGDSHTVGLKADGTVVAVGYTLDGACDVSGWTDIVAVGAGDCHTVGLKSDGTVVAKGNKIWGHCNVSEWANIVSISAGGYHTVGLKADGTVVAVGNDADGQCDVSDWTDIVAISAGAYHTVGLKADGTLVTVGENEEGQCDVSDWTDIKLP